MALKRKLLNVETYNRQPLTVDYLYNPTHVAGVKDVYDAIDQGLFDQKTDYDLVEMINDASEKVKTQKVLLVGHSQGNFYANNLYGTVTSKDGGVPRESIGVYGVGTPADRVAGGGAYLTSDTDGVIAALVGRYLSILPPNVHIPLGADDGNGHSFSNVYLKYQGKRIVSDIQLALGKLKENDRQAVDTPCIIPEELSGLHKAQGALLSVADPAAAAMKAAFGVMYDFGALVRDATAHAGMAMGDSIHGAVKNLLASAIETDTKEETSNGEPVSEVARGNTVELSVPQHISTPKPASSAKTESVVLALNNTPDQKETVLGGNSTPVPKKSVHHSSSRSHASADPEPTPPAEETPVTPDPDPEPEQEPAPDPEPTPEPDTPPEEEPAPDPVPDPTPDPEPEPDPVPQPDPDPLPDEAALSISDLNNNHTPDSEEPEVIVDRDATLPAGEYVFHALRIAGGATLTLEGDGLSPNEFKGVKIFAETITVEQGARMSATAQGYVDGPGGPPTWSFAGASYGGTGDRNEDAGPYGSAVHPVDLGSGGTGLFRGGGAIWLVVTGTLSNNGLIDANGDVDSSGGSMYVESGTLAGNGVFAADGGGLYPGSNIFGSGGGGRIAVYYEDADWSGETHAKGGCGRYDGFSFTCADDGTAALFDESAGDMYIENSWRFVADDAPFRFNRILVSHGANVWSDEDIDIDADELSLDDGSTWNFAEGETLESSLVIVDGGSTLILAADAKLDADTVTVAGNSTITTRPEEALVLDVKNLSIQNGSRITANGKGYVDGPGAPPESSVSGASYGGAGAGQSANTTYGSVEEPTDFGSGGTKFFRGGGAITLDVSDTLLNDGTISANGDATSSGGSIYITTKTLAGAGGIFANGGGTDFGTVVYLPGGGGRIAVYYEDLSFTGQILANGETSNAGNGSPGTVVLVDTDAEEEPAPDPDPIPEETDDPDAPSIASYTLDGAAATLTTDPLTDPVTLALTASENVDWVSVIIENEADPAIDKQFRSSVDGCADTTITCEKEWDGKLSSGGDAPAGTYRVKVHIKDAEGKEFTGDLSPFVIIVESSGETPPAEPPPLL